MTNTEAALDLARRGFRVHPLKAKDQPYTAYSRTATTIQADVAAMWKRWPNALIAIATGHGLVVVDVDPRNGGQFDATLARTLTSTTPGGGWHHYFWTRERIGNDVNLLPGLDLRGEGGYAVAPPSAGYAWLNDAVIKPLPAEIVTAIQAKQAVRRFGPGFEMAQRVAEGGRNDYIARFAGYAIRMGFDDYVELLPLVAEHNAEVCVPPLDDLEVRRTVRSILTRHERSA